MSVCACQSAHSAVQALDVKSDRLGLLVGGVDKEMRFLRLPLGGARHRIGGCSKNVQHLLGQGCDVHRQAVPMWRKKILEFGPRPSNQI